MTSLATQVSIIDRMKKMGKTVVDAGAKTMLKVGHYVLHCLHSVLSEMNIRLQPKLFCKNFGFG